MLVIYGISVSFFHSVIFWIIGGWIWEVVYSRREICSSSCLSFTRSWSQGNQQFISNKVSGQNTHFECVKFFLCNVLHPNISMHILLIVFYTFSIVPTRGVCFLQPGHLKLVIIFFVLMTLMFDVWLILYGEIRC